MTTYTPNKNLLSEIAEILIEASLILEELEPGNCPSNMRFPIVDELHGFAVMLRNLQPNTQEPVASLTVSNFRGHLTNHDVDYFGDLPAGDYSLYSHPAPQAKPLTNDELWTVWDDYYSDVASYDRQSFDVAFLRAVLKAAHGVKP